MELPASLALSIKDSLKTKLESFLVVGLGKVLKGIPPWQGGKVEIFSDIYK